MPVTFDRAAESATGLKMPLPAFFIFAAAFFPPAILPLLLCWPFLRLPPGYFTTFFFFFFFFFFFVFAFFFFFFFAFFFFFFFFFVGFFALAFLAFFGFDAFFAFFFLAAVSCVRASDLTIAFFTIVVPM